MGWEGGYAGGVIGEGEAKEGGRGKGGGCACEQGWAGRIHGAEIATAPLHCKCGGGRGVGGGYVGWEGGRKAGRRCAKSGWVGVRRSRARGRGRAAATKKLGHTGRRLCGHHISGADVGSRCCHSALEGAIVCPARNGAAMGATAAGDWAPGATWRPLVCTITCRILSPARMPFMHCRARSPAFASA